MAAARAAVTDLTAPSSAHENPMTDAAGPVGRRQIVTYNTTAQPTYATRDLSPDDFLNPQPGDEFFHGAHHDATVDYLVRCFRHLYRYNPFVAVLAGAKLIWDDPALAQPAPDIAVVANLADPHRFREALDITAEGVRPRFVLEVTSPRLAQIDIADKHAVYAQAQVPEYWIVQPSEAFTGAFTTGIAPVTVHAFLLDNGVYQPIPRDDTDRLYSPSNKVWFQIDAADGVRLVEQRTGRPITPPEEDSESSTVTQVEAAFRAQSIASKLNLDP